MPDGHLELLPKIPCHTTWVSTEAAPCSPGAGSANTCWAPPALETLQAGTQSHVTHAIGSRLHTSSSTCLLTALPAPTQSCQGPFQIHILSSTTSRARVGAGRIPLGRGLGDFAELPGARSQVPQLSQQDAALQGTWFTWQREGKRQAGASHTCVGGKDNAGLAEGCSHGGLFSLLQLLPQGLNLTQEMASLSLVLGLFGFCLENRKIGIEPTAATQFWLCL